MPVPRMDEANRNEMVNAICDLYAKRIAKTGEAGTEANLRQFVTGFMEAIKLFNNVGWRNSTRAAVMAMLTPICMTNHWAAYTPVVPPVTPENN